MIYLLTSFDPLLTYLKKMGSSHAVHLGTIFATEDAIKTTLCLELQCIKLLENFDEKVMPSNEVMPVPQSVGIAFLSVTECQHFKQVFNIDFEMVQDFDPQAGDQFITVGPNFIRDMSQLHKQPDQEWTRVMIISINSLEDADAELSYCQLCGVNLTATNTDHAHPFGKTNCRCCCESFDIAADHDKSQGL